MGKESQKLKTTLGYSGISALANFSAWIFPVSNYVYPNSRFEFLYYSFNWANNSLRMNSIKKRTQKQESAASITLKAKTLRVPLCFYSIPPRRAITYAAAIWTVQPILLLYIGLFCPCQRIAQRPFQWAEVEKEIRFCKDKVLMKSFGRQYL